MLGPEADKFEIRISKFETNANGKWHKLETWFRLLELMLLKLLRTHQIRYV